MLERDNSLNFVFLLTEFQHCKSIRVGKNAILSKSEEMFFIQHSTEAAISVMKTDECDWGVSSDMCEGQFATNGMKF